MPRSSGRGSVASGQDGEVCGGQREERALPEARTNGGKEKTGCLEAPESVKKWGEQEGRRWLMTAFRWFL